MMDMIALFFKQGDDIVVTARYAEISSGTGMTATFYVKGDKTTPDTDPSVKAYNSGVVADPDNVGATLSTFNIPSADTQVTGSWWWKVRVRDPFNHVRTANQGPLLIEAVLFAMVAGREVSPQDVENTERLMRYWAEGKGAAKLHWGVPGDYDKCLVELGKYVSDPHILHGLCANLHHRATGGWPGHAPGIEESEAQSKRRS